MHLCSPAGWYGRVIPRPELLRNGVIVDEYAGNIYAVLFIRYTGCGVIEDYIIYQWQLREDY